MIRYGMWAVAAILVGLSLGATAARAQTYDLVLRGGRVMDPESGMDQVMNVGRRLSSPPARPDECRVVRY